MYQTDRIQFWHYLVSGQESRGRAVFDRYSLEELSDKTVVAVETPNKKRAYAVFENPATLFRHIKYLPDDSKNFHEVILAWSCQKPRFDIDMTKDKLVEGENLEETGQKAVEMLLESIIKVMAQDNATVDIERQVILTSSHSSTKRSFHLILHEWMHTDHVEAGAFYEKVLAESEDPKFLQRFLDPGIYSANHCLRLLHNNKLGEFRPKKLMTQFMFRGQLWQHRPRRHTTNPKLHEFILFYESLINYTCYCEMMPVYQKKISYNIDIDLADGSVKRAMTLLAQDLGVELTELPFEIREVKGGLIDLHRLRPSLCKICDRVHEVVDPFLLVLETEFYFHCRRVPKGLKHARHIGSHIDGVVGSYNDFYDRARQNYNIEYFDVAEVIMAQPVNQTSSVPTSTASAIQITQPAIRSAVYFSPIPKPIEHMAIMPHPPMPEKKELPQFNVPVTGPELLKQMDSIRMTDRPARNPVPVTSTIKVANGRMPAKYTSGYNSRDSVGAFIPSGGGGGRRRK